jgi:hypothetical protein
MTSILQGSLAKKIGKAVGRLFYDCKVLVYTPGSGPAYDPGDPTYKTTTCKGMIGTYADSLIDGTLIKQGDAKVTITTTCCSNMPRPAKDKIVIRGNTYAIVNVSTDPAQALWICQCRLE